MKKIDEFKLLIVDDQPPMRETLREILRMLGYRNLVSVPDGRQAMKLIHRADFDGVITDWVMPHMSGIELLKTVKGNAELFELPVLMVTGYASPEKVLYAAEEGVDGFIVKPLAPKALSRTLEEALRKAGNPDAIQQKYIEMKRLKLSGAHREALELGNEILKKGDHPKAALLACECLCALKEYDKAIDMLSDSNEEDRTSQHSNLMGKIYSDLKRYQLAIMYFEESAKKNPLNHGRRIDLARVHFGNGQGERAQEYIDAIVRSEPTDLVLVEIAQLYLDLGEIDKAGFYLEKTVNPIEETVHVFNNYAVALRKAGRHEQSAAIYRKCIRIAPDSDILHYNLAFLYNIMGDTQNAKNALEQSLKLNPGNESAKNLLKSISAQS